MDSTDSDKPPKYSLKWFLKTEDQKVVFMRELILSIFIVTVIGFALFSISGVWPPMVAIESGSMEPHMQPGDLVFTVNEQKYSPEFAVGETGIVTHHTGEKHSYTKFGNSGDVIIYQPNGTQKTPVIHRAMFWVNESEDWTDKANPAYLPTSNCSELMNCPAPSAGFVTKGDANRHYDQAVGISKPVKSQWIRGTAEVRIPYLGYVRLIFG